MARRLKSPVDELEQLFSKGISLIVNDVTAIVRAKLLGNPDAESIAFGNFLDTMRHSMALSDLFGRRRLNMEARNQAVDVEDIVPEEPLLFGARFYQDDEFPSASPIVPDVPFAEAVDNLVQREPILAQSAEEVALAYSRDNVFALSRSANKKITIQVQAIIQRTLEKGDTVDNVARLIRDQDVDKFSSGYGRMVYRTSINTAYTAGRFREAQKPHVQAFFPAFRYVTARDADVRDGVESEENHAALDGMIRPINWVDWSIFAPPNGYNCRCTVVLMSVKDLERRNLIDDEGRILKDPINPEEQWVHRNFRRGRPDIQVYQTGALG